jgi:sugar phosphate isomerase/epimerase
MKTKKPLISVSVTDSPILLSHEKLFYGLRNAGVEAIELVIGPRSRWSLPNVQKTAERNDLIIQSVHQTIWSGLELAFDEGFIAASAACGIQFVTFHPLMRIPLKSAKMERYFEKISSLQEKYHITAMIENMAPKHGKAIFDLLIPPGEGTSSPEAIAAMARKFNLKMVYDTSHEREVSPQKKDWFHSILPTIGNIHLSSFVAEREHLPIHMGTFDSQGFLRYLASQNYTGLLTFEIFYPKSLSLFSYDFTSIKKSTDIVRSAYTT